ncbi:hypothetical protein ACYATP_00080 [Lactobacillaceae bacterium Melli_B4]
MEKVEEWFSKKNNKIITAVVVLILVLGGLYISNRPKHLDGNYNATVNILLFQSKDTFSFDGDKVREKDGPSGTYKIDGNKLEMDINNYTIKATLSDDNKSFTIDSATGLSNLASGTKYTKESK